MEVTGSLWETETERERKKEWDRSCVCACACMCCAHVHILYVQMLVYVCTSLVYVSCCMFKCTHMCACVFIFHMHIHVHECVYVHVWCRCAHLNVIWSKLFISNHPYQLYYSKLKQNIICYLPKNQSLLRLKSPYHASVIQYNSTMVLTHTWKLHTVLMRMNIFLFW